VKTEIRPPEDLLEQSGGDAAQRIEPNALYRFFSANDGLLYVGITKDLGTRLKSHNREKTWFREVAYIRVEHFDSREDVELAEYRAITEEHPLWNITYRVVPGAHVTLAEVIAAWEAIEAAVENYRTVLREALASGIQQGDIADALERTREMIRRDAMTDEQREELRQVEAERHRKRREDAKAAKPSK
jgi:predicted GIY-YIG superfamily endonuclease